MSIERGARLRTIGFLLALMATVAAGPAAFAQGQASEEEAARAAWMVRTGSGRARYEMEVKRTYAPGEKPVTTGFVVTRECAGGVRERVCMSAADLKRVRDEHFEIDPTLSQASFRMRFAGVRHRAVWDASGSTPSVSVAGVLSGDASVERGARAGGTAFGRPLSADRLEQAFLRRGADAEQDDDEYPAPGGPSLPGFGALSSSSGCWTPRPEEIDFKRSMNRERVSRGLRRMRLDPELSKAARVHTREMVRESLLHHTPSDTLRQRVTNWIVLGENVGVGGTPSSLHIAFMNSPAHKDNILFPRFNHVGVGSGTGDGRLWVTVIFESKQDPGTRLRMAC